MNVKTWLKQNKAVKGAEIVLATALKQDPAWLVVHEDSEIEKKKQAEADKAVAKLREGMPIEYILGAVEFYSNWLKVTPEVLIPRPETELVVDLALEVVRKIDNRVPKILDVGAGSGCIAISLVKKLPEAKVYATDVSPKALRVARVNAKTNNVAVRFLPPTSLMNGLELDNYDIVIANLPYVDKNWDWINKKRLSYEPKKALFAEDGGLKLIKELIDQIVERNIDKHLVLEADPCQHEAVINYAENKGLKHLKTNGFGLLFGVTAERDV